MLNIVLVEPEIPPNTGNIIRLAANTGCQMHVIKPLGFTLDDKRLRRAGLDYDEWCNMQVHESWDDFLSTTGASRLFALSTKGTQRYSDIQFHSDDYLIFGPETRGLTEAIRQHPKITEVLRIPMQAHSRSMNLSNAVAVMVFEALRQLDFPGAS